MAIKTKTCSICQKTLPLEEFYSYEAKKTGKEYRRADCKKCYYIKKTASAQPRYASKKPVIGRRRPGSLDFLDQLITTKRVNSVTLEEAKKFTAVLQSYVAAEKQLDYKYLSKTVGKSIGFCKAFLRELKLAKQDGMTLQMYMATGRKFRAGYKPIAQ